MFGKGRTEPVNWEAVGALGELVGAVGSIMIACLALYIATRQWLDGKRFSREQRELTEEIERNSDAAKQEQERIVRAQSLDSYFDGISTLLLRDEDGALNQLARNLTKGRTDAILKILKSDEKRNLVAFLYGSGLISQNGAESPSVVALSGSDLSLADLSGIDLRNAGFGGSNLKGAQITEADLDHSDLRGANLSQANLSGTDLSFSDMHGVIATTANFSSVDLSDADLSGADLRGVDFSEADLSSANLSGSNLREAKLTGANLSSANLSGANLREAGFVGANLLDTRLTNLISIEDADFSGAQNLSEDNREYLRSIATGAHPETGKNTAESLNQS